MSSVITNVINTEFRAVGSQAMAYMSNQAAGARAWGRELQGVQNMSERLNTQWRAFGTTIRYAIAGSAVFALTRMVSQLKEIQVQMGLISAIGTGAGGQPFTGSDLTGLMDDIRKGAIDSMTPVNQYTSAVINLLSTLQNVPQDQITPMVTTISQAAQLAQVSAEDLTKAVTTIGVAFGKSSPDLTDIRKFSQEFFILTKEAPGGITAGQQIIQQVGQLAAITRAAHGTPEQMFGLALSGLRGGIPPAQAGRSLQFLLQTIAFPGAQTKDAKAALGSVGITPLSNMTLTDRLNAIFKRAGALGVHGDLNTVMNLDEDTASQLDATGNVQGNLQNLGITGQGAVFLGTVFRRIHALRMALALSTQAESGQLQQDLQTMTNASQGIVSDSNDLAKATKRMQDQAPLQKAAVALDDLRLQFAQDVLGPIINPVARGASFVASQAENHPKEARVAFAAAAIAGLGLGARGFFRGKGERIGKGAGTIEDILSLRNINGPLGSSVANPMYVRVVGDLWNLRNPVFDMPGGGGGGKKKAAEDAAKAAENAAKKDAIKEIENKAENLGLSAIIGGIAGRVVRKIPGAKSVISRLPKLTRVIGLGGAVAGEAGLAARLGLTRVAPFMMGPYVGAAILEHEFGLDTYLGKKLGLPADWSGKGGYGPFWRDITSPFRGSGDANTNIWQPMINANKARFSGGNMGLIQTKPGEMTFNFNIKHPDGNLKAKVHTPVDLWVNGRAPSQSGQTGKGKK